MKNFIQPGQVLTLTAPEGGVSSGDGVQVGQLFVVAVADAAAGDPFEGQTVGVFDLPKDDSDAWTEGELVYWDGTQATVTADGNLCIGCAATAAAEEATTGRVRLNGVAQANEPSES